MSSVRFVEDITLSPVPKPEIPITMRKKVSPIAVRRTVSPTTVPRPSVRRTPTQTPQSAKSVRFGGAKVITPQSLQREWKGVPSSISVTPPTLLSGSPLHLSSSNLSLSPTDMFSTPDPSMLNKYNNSTPLSSIRDSSKWMDTSFGSLTSTPVGAFRESYNDELETSLETSVISDDTVSTLTDSGMWKESIHPGIEQYKLDRVLGSGQFGIVYLALRDEGPVAVKMINVDALVSANISLDTITNEILALRELSYRCSEHVVMLLDSFMQEFSPPGMATRNNYIFIVTEYIDGVSLDPRGYLQIEILWKLMKVLLVSLECIHEEGYAHGDIKPDNIMVAIATGKVKYLDLGLSCKNTCMGAGTTEYLPPESFDRSLDHSDGRIQDVWALGTTFFQLCNGRMPTSHTEKSQYSYSRSSRYSNSHINHIIDAMRTYNRSDRPLTSQILDYMINVEKS